MGIDTIDILKEEALQCKDLIEWLEKQAWDANSFNEKVAYGKVIKKIKDNK